MCAVPARSAQADETQHPAEVTRAPAQRLLDRCRTGQAQDADREVSQRRHDPGAVLLADAAAVLVVRHVAHMVKAVLDRPVAAHQAQEFGTLLGLRLRAGRDRPARDAEDDLGACVGAVERGDVALEGGER